MSEILLAILVGFVFYKVGTLSGADDAEKKINSACLIAREVQVADTVIYCKPIAIMVDGQRQELKDGSLTSTQP